MHLTLTLIRALHPNAPSNAFIRLVNASASPIADPSIVVDLARKWDPSFPCFYTKAKLVCTKNPFARALLHDYFDYQESWVYPGMDTAKLYVLQLYGVAGTIKDTLIAQWVDTARPDLRDLFIYESRARRRAEWVKRAIDLGRPTLSKSESADGLFHFGRFLFANKRYGNDVLISPKQIFDLFFDIMAAVPSQRRKNFMRRLSRRIHTENFRCEANLVLASQLREALKNDVKNLSLEEINARFP